MSNETEAFNHLPLWEQTQYKTFRNWVNINLKSSNSNVKALEADFKNGVRLAQLIEVLQKKKIGKWVANPKQNMHEIENLGMAITAIQKDNIKIVNIGSGDIHDGNLKIIMGLIWTLIQHYHINQLDFLDIEESSNKDQPNTGGRRASIQVGGLKKLSAKDKLLAIVNEIIQPWGYKAHNFTTDFEDGKILACLAHTRDPKTIRDPVNFGNDKHANVKEVLEGYEKLGIPHVMDVDSIVDKHDEKSMMTLLGYVLKEIGTRPQVVSKPGEFKGSSSTDNKSSSTGKSSKNEDEEEEIIEEDSNVKSSKTVQSTTANLGELPKLKIDRKSLFNRFVEIGRVVYITFGEYEGQIAAILDVVDANTLLISGPQGGVPRTQISLKRVQLTDILIPMRRNPRVNTFQKAWTNARVQELWDRTAWGQRVAARKRKAEMNDFDRFKVLVAKQKRSKLIREKRKTLIPNKKQKK
jgi:ribosomal protein L14E/L6E/L27E